SWSSGRTLRATPPAQSCLRGNRQSAAQSVATRLFASRPEAGAFPAIPRPGLLVANDSANGRWPHRPVEATLRLVCVVPGVCATPLPACRPQPQECEAQTSVHPNGSLQRFHRRALRAAATECVTARRARRPRTDLFPQRGPAPRPSGVLPRALIAYALTQRRPLAHYQGE